MLRPFNIVDRFGFDVSLEISIDGESEKLEVDSNFITEMAIDRDYLNAQTTLIRIGFSLGKEEYLKFQDNIKDMMFNLNIKKFRRLEGDDPDKRKEGGKKEYLKGSYRGILESDMDSSILSTIRPNDKKSSGVNSILLGATQGMDINPIVVYLFDPKHVEKYNKPIPINLDERHGKTDFLYYSLVKRGYKNVLMTPVDDNAIGDIALSDSDLGTTLSILDEQYGIYKNAPYMFFTENKVTYIVDPSRLGSTKVKGGNGKVSLFLESPTEREGFIGGCVFRDGKQFIALATPPTLTKLDAVDYLNADNTRYTTIGKQPKHQVNNPKNTKNKMEKTIVVHGQHGINHDRFRKMSNQKTISLSVDSIDDSLITIEKEYSLVSDKTYKSMGFDGKYLLVRKVTTMSKEMDGYSSNTVLIMKKVEKAVRV